MTIRFDPRVTLGRAWAVVAGLVDDIATRCPEIISVTPAGGMRRVEAIVQTIVLVALADDPDAAMASLDSLDTATGIERQDERSLLLDYRKTEIDVRVASPDEYGTVLF